MLLHNFCELNNGCITSDQVCNAFRYDHEFQPLTAPNRYITEVNEAERKLNILIHKCMV